MDPRREGSGEGKDPGREGSAKGRIRNWKDPKREGSKKGRIHEEEDPQREGITWIQCNWICKLGLIFSRGGFFASRLLGQQT